MKQHEFISSHQIARERRRHFRAFLASSIFHGFLICLLLGLSFIYWSHFQPPKSGSPQGGQSLSLSTLIIVSSPPQIPPPLHLPDPDQPSVSSSSVIKAEPPVPEESIPVLAPQPAQAPPMQKAKVPAQTHSPASHVATTTDATPTHAKPVASAAASYAAGASVLPHPPYPSEARDLRQTGTVTMSVQFDEQGEVTQARVLQSSGVPLLDATTRTFIRDHWHSAAYAGQTVNVPIQYKLENF